MCVVSPHPQPQSAVVRRRPEIGVISLHYKSLLPQKSMEAGLCPLLTTSSLCSCRIAVFSVTVLHDERIVIVAEQRPDSTEEDSFQWMSRVLQVACLCLTASQWVQLFLFIIRLWPDLCQPFRCPYAHILLSDWKFYSAQKQAAQMKGRSQELQKYLAVISDNKHVLL